MNYAEIKRFDIANGIGVRISLFVSGCRNHCPNCFNEATWDFNYGKEFNKETQDEILDLLSREYVRGLTLIGGEPMEPENQRGLLPFVKKVREIYPNKDIWCYTGFTYEELSGDSRGNCEVTEELLSLIDVLVDGRYIDELRNISLKFRGSENQRLIDLKETIKTGKVTLWEE